MSDSELSSLPITIIYTSLQNAVLMQMLKHEIENERKYGKGLLTLVSDLESVKAPLYSEVLVHFQEDRVLYGRRRHPCTHACWFSRRLL